jgi:hypothetical protein
MIKKFEEFVNENYNRRENWTPEEIEQFGSFLTDVCGYERSQWRRMQEFIMTGGYTFEEIMNIFNRLSVADHPTMDMLNYLKQLFDFDKDELTIKRKQEILDAISQEYNDGKTLPVVVDVNGKLLTGVVFYSETFDAYAADLDDFICFEDDLYVMAAERGILDDDQPDWVDYYWDNTDDGYEVDLDKEFGWTEK